jgi:hypothetical protein
MSRVAASLLVVFVGSAWMLALHHDRSWWPPDEGQYAHVAERMLDGARLHRDIRDPHTDYGHWLNAGAFALFGRDLRSLRYAPALASLGCALLVAWLLRERGAWLASVTALATTALGFVQFPNPTPNWYGPLWTAALCAVLGRPTPARIFASGAVVGLAFGFRQPTGAFLGLGALAVLLTTPPPTGPPASPRAARAMLAAAAGALASALWATTDALGWALYGIWPAALLALGGWRTRVDDRTAFRRAAGLAAGGGAALLPMGLWHLLHGTSRAWLDEVITGALGVARLGYLGDASYGSWLGPALRGVASPSSVPEAVNALYWLALLSLGAVAGAAMVVRLLRAERLAAAATTLPLLACFHALVALLNQIPIYAYYAAGLLLAGIVQLLAPRSRSGRVVLGCGVLGFAAIGLGFHASQPHTRSIAQAIRGDRVVLVESRSLPRASLWMEPGQERAYRDLLERVAALTGPADRILVVPNDAEVYFLSERDSAVDFWNSALGIGGPREEAALVRRLRDAPPALIVYARGDKATTPALRRVLDEIDDLYAPPERVHYFELWRRALRGAGSWLQGPMRDDVERGGHPRYEDAATRIRVLRPWRLVDDPGSTRQPDLEDVEPS